MLLMPCSCMLKVHFIFIEQAVRMHMRCPEHAFSCPIERQK